MESPTIFKKSQPKGLKEAAMSVDFSQYEGSEKAAVIAVNQLTLEGLVSANVIGTFRNVFPKTAECLEDSITRFTARDVQEFNFEKNTREFQDLSGKLAQLNFVAISDIVVSCPEGMNSKIMPYVRYLNKEGVELLSQGSKLLQDYRYALSNFISSKDAKTSLRDYTSFYKGVELKLADVKKGISSFFNVKSPVSVLPLYALYDRESDIAEAVKARKNLNEVRIQFDKADLLGQIKDIASLLDLVIETSRNKEVQAISSKAADSIAQGALALAHYVEMMGVIRYRLEELITAVGLQAKRIKEIKD